MQRERLIYFGAEGATTLETLRQKDRCSNNSERMQLPHRRIKFQAWTDRELVKSYFEVQKTALYQIQNLGAKFVPFAGYEMPIQYKDGL